MQTLASWLGQPSDLVRRQLGAIYGNGTEHQSTYLRLLQAATPHFGEAGPWGVFRAPARINLKGVHIDHRGGPVNYLVIDREILFVVRPRQDDRVVLQNLDTDRYPPGSFRISEGIPPASRGNWLAYLEQATPPPGDWVNYVKAAAFRLQDHFPRRSLVGFDGMVYGTIPTAVGLGSSSALVVASMDALLWANGLTLEPDEKVTLCGEAEWYVGTRGGAGDHAAMIYGQRDHITHTWFFPLQVRQVPFPDGIVVLACNSLKKAKKAAGAKSTFNERVATYEIGMLLIRQSFPEYRQRLVHLRDLSAQNLGVDETAIYTILKTLPQRINRQELWARLPEQRERLNQLFQTHDEPLQGYRVRDVCLFGLAEIARSQIFAEYVQMGQLDAAGALMYLSHNGDRQFSFDGQGQRILWQSEVDDQRLDELIADLGGSDPDKREAAGLWRQPGGYGCSCEELDLVVDIARKEPGVLGAGLTGAGLGGCVLVLVQSQAVESVWNALENGYYRPRGLPTAIIVCRSVAGAGMAFQRR